jgi:hypothetical protein
LRDFNINYTEEPRGYPLGLLSKKEMVDYKRNDGPDGMAVLMDGQVAVEIHCSMPTSFHSVESKHTNYCQLAAARNEKKKKYREAKFCEKFEVKLLIFSCSALGTIYKDVYDELKEEWIPKMENPRGFLRALCVETLFATARYLGIGVRVAQLRAPGSVVNPNPSPTSNSSSSTVL